MYEVTYSAYVQYLYQYGKVTKDSALILGKLASNTVSVCCVT